MPPATLQLMPAPGGPNLRHITRAAEKSLPKDYGFVIMAIPVGHDGPTAYTSNLDPESADGVLLNFVEQRARTRLAKKN